MFKKVMSDQFYVCIDNLYAIMALLIYEYKTINMYLRYHQKYNIVYNRFDKVSKFLP